LDDGVGVLRIPAVKVAGDIEIVSH
jgi:hypothetical protein